MERPDLPVPLGPGKLAVDFPDQLGRYAAIASLGDGGMAQVFLAIQRGPYASNKLVVIKRVKAESRHDPTFQQMFVDEARIAMLLSHPNIVNTYDLVAEGDALYLTMEYIEGHSLLETMKRVGRAGVPRELHVWILSKVLAALAYAHTLRDFKGSDLGIVHRDVSPSNVILTYRGEVKLLDFGIAKAAGRLSTTHDGMLKGKVRYMSPEQCSRQPVSARSDLYSVGVMLWEGLARERMHPNATPVQIAEAHSRGLRKPIEEAWPNVPATLIEVLRRALAIDPAERYASASEFQRDLQEYLSSLPTTTQPGSATLAGLVSEAFAVERAGLRETIVARVAESADGDTPSGPSASVAAPESGPRRMHPSPSQPVPLPPTSPSTSLGLPVAAAAEHKRVRLFALGGAVLLGTIGVALAFRHGGSSSQSAAVPPALPSLAPAPAAAPLPAARAAAAPPVEASTTLGRAPAAPTRPVVEPVAARNVASPRPLPDNGPARVRPKPTAAITARGSRGNGRVDDPPSASNGLPARTPPGQPLPPATRLTTSPDHEPGMDLGRPDPRRAATRAIDERDPYAP